ncbi:MAG: alcohol dehydrogenase catalytic domain-containing protein [Pseudonocardia sp.]
MGPGDVVVRLAVSALCPLDLSWEGSPQTVLPAVPGHEGTGTVLAVGPSVVDVEIGDSVVVTRTASCGWCYWCARGEGFLCEVSGPATGALHGSGAGWAFGTLADEVVVPVGALVRLHPSADLVRAGHVGCGLLTGVAAVRRARIHAGDTVLVLGCDGVGLHCVQAARIVGAADVVAVDEHEAAREAARRLGAVQTVAGAEAAQAVMDRTAGRGADIVLVSPAWRGSWSDAVALARRGGRVLVVHGPEVTRPGPTSVLDGVLERSVSVAGFHYGSSHPREDIALLLELVGAGSLHLGHDLAAVLPFDQAAHGWQLLRDGEAVQVVLVH